MIILENAAAVLKLFSQHGMIHGDMGISFTYIMNTLGLPKSTTSRLLTAMEKQQLLEREPNSKLYHIGQLVLAACSRYLSMPFIDMVTPFMSQLTKETTRTGYISILEGTNIKVMRVFPGSQFIQIVTPVGNIWPAAETAIGRALLARKTDVEIDEIYQQGYHVASLASPQTLDDLFTELNVIRNQQWAFACNENQLGISTIATSICNKHMNEVIGLCLSAPSNPDCSLFSQDALDKLLDIAQWLAVALADDFLLKNND